MNMEPISQKLAAAEPLARPDVVPQRSNLLFKINNFDLVRLFAALQVAIVHTFHRFNTPLPPLLMPLSWFPGVPIFFVISGYLISASYQRSNSIKHYALNRATRIFPGLWGVLIATILAVFFFGFGELSPRFFLWFSTQLVGLIYTPVFLRDFGDGTYNGSLWTIPVELQFYAALPILYGIMHRTKMNNIVFLVFTTFTFVAIGAALVWLLPNMGVDDAGSFAKVVRYTFVPRFYMFLTGALLQTAAVYKSNYIRNRGLYWLMAFVIIRNIIPSSGSWYIIPEILLAVTAISLAYTVPTLAERVMRGTDVSYGIYLYHGLVITVLIELAIPKGTALPLTIGASVVLGSLSWFFIERPVLQRWRDRPRVASASMEAHS